jgi:hypothetical protein
VWFLEHKLLQSWLFGDKLAAHKCIDVVLNAPGKNAMCWIFSAKFFTFCSHWMMQFLTVSRSTLNKSGMQLIGQAK